MKGSTIFKFTLSALSLLLLGLLYWSNTLLETDLKWVKNELYELRLETAGMTQKIQRDLSSLRQVSQSLVPESRTSTLSLADSRYPNLLEEDAYFSKTLPSLLGENFRPQGVLKKALVGRPDHLHPFHGFRDVSHMVSMCTVKVADGQFGKYETCAPDMALKIEARPRADFPDAQEYWVHLRDDVFWQPLKRSLLPEGLDLAPCFFEKHPVTAHDFKFFFNAVMNPHVSEAKAVALRSYFEDIEEIVVLNDYTFVVRWKAYPTNNTEGGVHHKVKYTSLGLTCSLQPLPCFVYQCFADGQKIIEDDSDLDCYRNNSIWAQNFSHHWAKNYIVSCGPYLFDGMTDEGISFKRNPDHYNPYAALVEGVQYRFKESVDAIWQDFKTGKIDICTLSPNQLTELDSFLESVQYQDQKAHGMGVEHIDFVDLSFYYLGWNLAKPQFTTKRVRQALTMAIDRNRIIEQNLNQMGIAITGPLSSFSSAYDTTIDPWPFNPDAARHLLEEEGWVDVDGDGVRDKWMGARKVAFRFKLYYFVKSLSAKVIAEYIATAFREIGIECQLCGLDLADLSRQFEDKNFDAILMGWKLGTPPEDPRQLWHSSGAAEKGSSNIIGYANQDVDQIIDDLAYEYSQPKRTQLYRQFHRIIHEDAPYTFLYTPKVRLLYREYVKNIFIPRDRQDVIAEADVPEPNQDIVWIDHR